MRVGDMKIMAECFDTASSSFKGKLILYNVTADISETQDLADAQPGWAFSSMRHLSHSSLKYRYLTGILKELSDKLLHYAKQAAMTPPLEGSAPWQGVGYYCAKCTPGEPVSGGPLKPKTWEVWCKGPVGTTC